MDKSSVFGLNRSLSGTPKSVLSRNKALFPTQSRRNVSLSGRSNASTLQIVARSEYNIVEFFGSQLPVKVNEILTFSDSKTTVSVSFSKNGWAWAVSGRKLLVWQYKDNRSSTTDSGKSNKSRSTTSQCRLLTLPHCDIGHKARLITVFVPENSQMAACLAVSTTGDVRYWPSIAHDGSSIDETGILEGQEFDQLTSINPLGYLLVTTTCNLVLLQLQVQNGRQNIVHRTIRQPTGFLGGIGKRFSIIIGMNSNQESENKLIKICYESINSIEYHVTVLSDNSLQRWLFSPNTNDTFLYEDSGIQKKVREIFRQKIWNNRDMNENISLWLLDMQSVAKGVTILVGAANLAHTPEIHFALVTFIAENDGFKLQDFQLMRFKSFYNYNDQQNKCLNIKFIICRGMAYIYNDKTIYPVILNTATGGNPSQSGSNDDLEKIEQIDFQTQDDKIMCAVNSNNIPLFFSRNHGLVCITPSDFEPDIFNSSVSSDIFSPITASDASMNIFSPNTTNVGNLTMYELDPEEIYEENKDPVSQLKAAFIYHMKRNTPMCNGILNELLKTQTESNLDRIVLTIAEDLSEDVPAADPRWESDAGNRHPLGSSTSLQIIQQLREKNLALGHFIEFLHASGLWGKLNRLGEKSMCHILSDINEKIVATIALKCLHNSHARIMDEAIDLVLKDNNVSVYGSLTNQDLFYIKITKIHEIFKKFVEMVENFVNNEYKSAFIQNAIIEINTIILQVLQEVMKFRETKENLFKLPEDKRDLFEYLPWTASSDKDGLKDTLLQMVTLTLNYGIKSTGEPEYKFKHYQHMTEMVDFILDGRRSYLASVKDKEKLNVLQHQYESQRFDLIYPLVSDEQFELAAKLAEKYLDFQTLVIICDQTDNQSRLDEYIERFKDYDFSQFAISWHMKQNKQGDLFERFKGNQIELAKFLNNHPSLAWIQLIFNGQLEKASIILLELAQGEEDLVARKRTMLSLAKLAAFAAESDLSQHIVDINKELHLINHQEQIPLEVAEQFGYDTNNFKVMRPEEMIDLYISEENENATEEDFRKALELLEYVEDPFDYRHKVWCAAILRDDWITFNMNAPMEKMQEMLFFKLIDLCYLLDQDIQNFLPPIDSFLTAPELLHLANEKSFQYLMKLGYEHIYQSYNGK